ncbi:MAG: alpha/beta fold hydrolase [Kofleriaceae bacterium]
MRTVLLGALSAIAACSGSSSSPTGSEIAGCDDAKLLASDPDLSRVGPWGVGVKTTMLGSLQTEVWYPVAASSIEGATKARYDIRAQLPSAEAAKIPDDDNPWQTCDCVRDAPLDAEHGPYPVIVFVHGTAAFRHQSLAIVTHWVSHGFVVIAADHPGLKLGDVLGMACGAPSVPQTLSADIDAEIAALRAPTGDLAFLANHVDTTRIAVAGHSAGGSAAAEAGSKANVRAVISMAGNKAATSTSIESTMFLAGQADTVVSAGQVRTAWSGSVSPRRYIALAEARHLAFSDLCETTNAQGQDLLEIANEHGVCGAQLAGFLFDCSDPRIDPVVGWNIINDATTSVLRTTLQCLPQTDIASIRTRYPDVGEYQEAL